MSDAHMRDLERAVAATGSVEDEAALLRARLRARLRAGDECGRGCEGCYRGPAHGVPCRLCEWTGAFCPRCNGLSLRERVELAAWCRSASARILVNDGTGARVRWGNADDLPLDSWLSGLERWGPPVMVRAACAAARVALEVWENSDLNWVCGDSTDYCFTTKCWTCQSTRDNIDRRPRLAIQAARTWLECPCEEHRKACHYGHDDVLPQWAHSTLAAAYDPPGVAHAHVADAVGSASQLAGEPAAREAVQIELTRWALT